MRRTRIQLLAALALTCLGMFSTDLAHAVPPSSMRGIDISAVLAMHDRSRQTQHLLTGAGGASSLKKIRTIVLDPGHGGDNQGAIGVAEIHEKFLTLELAYQLRDELQRQYPTLRVVLTRYWDEGVGLSERIAYANALEADLFISLHYNAATHDRAIGHETYFLTTSQAIPGEEERKGEPIAAATLTETGMKDVSSKQPQVGAYNDTMAKIQVDLKRQVQHQESALLAGIVNQAIAERLTTIDRGVKQANFAVLRGALMPAVVLEAGFVTHPREGSAVVKDRHRTKICEAVMSAVVGFDETLASRK